MREWLAGIEFRYENPSNQKFLINAMFVYHHQQLNWLTCVLFNLCVSCTVCMCVRAIFLFVCSCCSGFLFCLFSLLCVLCHIWMSFEHQLPEKGAIGNIVYFAFLFFTFHIISYANFWWLLETRSRSHPSARRARLIITVESWNLFWYPKVSSCARI